MPTGTHTIRSPRMLHAIVRHPLASMGDSGSLLSRVGQPARSGGRIRAKWRYASTAGVSSKRLRPKTPASLWNTYMGSRDA